MILKPGREKSIHRRHPWVFSGAIMQVTDQLAPGETVRIVTQHGECLALGSYSPRSQIRLRVWFFDPNEVIDGNFFKKRIKRALLMRRSIIGNNHATLRLVNGESDVLPGLVVDKYGDYLVCQFLPELFRKIIADAALDAGRDASIVTMPEQPADHPLALNFPKGRYLKELVCYLP